MLGRNRSIRRRLALVAVGTGFLFKSSGKRRHRRRGMRFVLGIRPRSVFVADTRVVFLRLRRRFQRHPGTECQTFEGRSERKGYLENAMSKVLPAPPDPLARL